MSKIILILLALLIQLGVFGQSVTATYTLGNSNTDSGFQSLPGASSCPIPLSVTIPAGARITGVDVAYTMVTANSGWRDEQRSELRCVSPGGVNEGVLAVGCCGSGGTQNYNRTGLNIANGVTGGGVINFELHAGRTWSSAGYAGCSMYNNRVNNNWTITVHYA